ncbi:uncharacterized protein LOC130796442 [Actinidia eriantha]|uniref:uncharacterized protein LOC130796442 n=1 Tax=Actinidia eriantha TaxID=165200 RepID=UPI00258A3B86|nr:uncharacterized protein LOC130796442 [Actinidia eriantha]
MPTFTAIALDRLIESGASKSMTIRKNVHDSKSGRINNTTNSKLERGMNNSSKPPLERRNNRTPALYATPESTPLPDSPSSFPPSPYIINHKRRGPRLLKSYSEDDIAAHKRAIEEEKVDENAKLTENEATDSAKDATSTVSIPSPGEEERVNGTCNGEHGVNHLANGLTSQNGSAVQNRLMKSVASNCEEGGELEDFLPQDSISAKSNTEGESNSGVERSLYLNQPVAEFYDACDELSFESGPQPSPRDVEAELREIRLTLLMEREKRKQAEETLDDMRTKWLTIRQQLSLVGLTLPADPIASMRMRGADPVWGGNPAKFLRKLTDEEIAFISESATNYCNLAQVHAAENAKSFDEIEFEKMLRKKFARRDEEYDSMLGVVRETPPELILPDNVLPNKAPKAS